MVTDARTDPRVDMQMANSIGKMISSVGKMEQNRQKRYKIDSLMSDINNGVAPMEAVQNANRQEPAPYSPGLAGVGQRAGRFVGGAPRDLSITDDLVATNLFNKLKMDLQQSDPQYQAALEATNVGIAGDKQRQDVVAQTTPGRVAAQGLQNKAAEQNIAQKEVMNPLQVKAAETNIKGAEQNIEQSAERFPAEMQRIVQGMADDKIKMGWAQEDADRSATLFAFREELEEDKKNSKVSEAEYSAKKRAYELAGMDLDNKYKEAKTDAIASDAKAQPSKDLISMQKQIDSFEGDISDNLLNALKEQAESKGLEIKETTTTRAGREFTKLEVVKKEGESTTEPTPANNQEEYDKLSVGTRYIDKNGKVGIKK